MFIHHYTNIDVLALILKNKTIRFNRLDRVDDKEESVFISKGINLGPYTFVSCWTETDEESIPMWKMYTNKSWGVRLKIPRDNLFKTYNYDDFEFNGLKAVSMGGRLEPLFPPEVQFQQSDFTPPFLTPDYEACKFYRKVIYVDNTHELAENVIHLPDSHHGAEGPITINFSEVGRYKHKRWAFQEESRFVLNFMPGNPASAFNTADFDRELLLSVQAIKSNKELGFSYYDMQLNPKAFDKLSITLSPLATDSQRAIVASLRDKYAPNATIMESNLSGILAK